MRVTEILAHVLRPLKLLSELGPSCKGACRQGRTPCPGGNRCSWLSDADLAGELEHVAQPAGPRANVQTIGEVIALEHAAADAARVTGLPLEDCQKHLRRGAALAAGRKEGGTA